jgi:hypothetical protein
VGIDLALRILTVAGYNGTRNSLFVAVANRPRAFLTLTAELAAAALPLGLAEPEVLLLWLLRLPTTPPTTAPMTIMMRRGTPNLTQLLTDFFRGRGVI